MDEWQILVLGGAVVYAVMQKIIALDSVHLEWGLVELKFNQRRKQRKKPLKARTPSELKQVRRLPRIRDSRQNP